MTTLKQKNNNENLLKAISFLRLDLTYDELGEKLGYKKATISKYINGVLPPSSDFLNKFEDVFKIKLNSFNTTTETKTPPPESERADSNSHYEKLINYYISLVDRIQSDLDFERSKNNKI